MSTVQLRYSEQDIASLISLQDEMSKVDAIREDPKKREARKQEIGEKIRDLTAKMKMRPEDYPPLHIQMKEWRFRIHKGPRRLEFDTTATYRAVGLRYTSKSSLGEAVATKILHQGGTVLDLFSAKSNEGLAWADSPYSHHLGFIVADNCAIQTNFPVYKVSDFLSDAYKIIRRQRILVMVRAFFESEEAYFYALMKIIGKLSERDEHMGEDGAPDLILIREAQQFLKAANTAAHIHNQKAAEQVFIDFHDEAVQTGFSVFADSKRVNTIVKDVRDTNDYAFYKNMGAEDLPDTMHHLFNEYSSDMFRSLAPWEFILHTRWNAVGLGVFEYPWWHIRRGKSLKKKFDIRIRFEGRDVTVLEETNFVGRPRGGRKVTKAIHDFIVSEYAKGTPRKDIVRSIFEDPNMKVNLSGPLLSVEIQKHKAGMCGYCQGKA